MTDEEIIESYRRAKFPAKQVGIISELTLRPKADIIKVLEGAGFDIPSGRVNSSWNKEKETFLVKARAEGRTYEEIAKELGNSVENCYSRYRQIKRKLKGADR